MAYFIPQNVQSSSDISSSYAENASEDQSRGKKAAFLPCRSFVPSMLASRPSPPDSPFQQIPPVSSPFPSRPDPDESIAFDHTNQNRAPYPRQRSGNEQDYNTEFVSARENAVLLQPSSSFKDTERGTRRLKSAHRIALMLFKDPHAQAAAQTT